MYVVCITLTARVKRLLIFSETLRHMVGTFEKNISVHLCFTLCNQIKVSHSDTQKKVIFLNGIHGYTIRVQEHT